MSTPPVTVGFDIKFALTAPEAALPAGGLLSIDTIDVDRVSPNDEPRVRALVEAARTGDREAFGELVVMYERVVFRTALAALGRREDAEDAAQDAFIVAWRKLRGYRGASTFRTWMLTIVWRKALDRRRIRRLWWMRTADARHEGEADAFQRLAASGTSPEREAISRDLADRVRGEIRRLSRKLQDTLLLAACGEYSYEEISAMLRTPVGTVKWRVAEARRLIKERLEA